MRRSDHVRLFLGPSLQEQLLYSIVGVAPRTAKRPSRGINISIRIRTSIKQQPGHRQIVRKRRVPQRCTPAFRRFFQLFQQHALVYIGAQIEELSERWLVALGNPRSDASSRRIAAQLPGEPIITIARAAEMASVSNTAADNAVRALEAAGILKRLNAKRWGRVWETSDVFRLLDDFERELATPESGDEPARPAPRHG